MAYRLHYWYLGGLFMSPKFYSFLWVIFFATAGVMWIAGVLSMVAIVTFGFFAFGLVFMGMMNVLPIMVTHPVPAKESFKKSEMISDQRVRPAELVSGMSVYRSA